MLNRIMLIGNLGRKPEFKKTENGLALALFSLATSEYGRDADGNLKETTEWHNVTMFRELAERAQQQLDKGMKVLVEGKISHSKYTDAAGIDRYRTEIVATMFKVIDRREAKTPDKTLVEQQVLMAKN